MPQILLYDEKEMHVFDVVGYHPEDPLVESVDIATIEQVQMKKAIFQDWSYRAKIAVGKVKAELDPTTMKRIAKYNLDKDFEELNRQIKFAEEKLESLNKEAEEKKEKLKFMGELLLKVWNDRDFDKDNFLLNEYEEEY